MLTRARSCFIPNEQVAIDTKLILISAWAMTWLACWWLLKPIVMPSPIEVLAAFPDAWFKDGLGQALISSLTLNLQALALSTSIALPLAYASKTPIMRPAALAVSKLRFLSPTAFYLILLFTVDGGHEIKLYMLTLGELFFLVTTMIGVVSAIPAERFDDARTLRMSEWQVTWYVVIRGTFHEALSAICDNAAMGWSMLMFVEGIVRSEGGVGVMLTDQDKHARWAEVYAITTAVIAVGLAQDYALGWIRRSLCPYAEMVTQ